MKLGVVGVIVGLAFLPMTADAAKYQVINATAEVMTLMDMESIHPRKPYTRVWVTVVFPKPLLGVSFTKNLQDMDCDEKRFRIIARSSYDETGKSTAVPEPSSDWQYAVPGTTGEGMVKLACGEPPSRRPFEVPDVEMLRVYREGIRTGIIK